MFLGLKNLLKCLQNRPTCSNHLIKVRSTSKSVVKTERIKDVEFKNEPILEYGPGSEEFSALNKSLEYYSSNIEEVPIIIDGEEFRTDNIRYQVMPHRRSQKIAKFYYADEKIINHAIATSIVAQKKWDETPLKNRIEIWEKAADIMSQKYRGPLVGATMLGQSKTIYQAEIDAGAELIDFMRMNAAFLKQATNYHPITVDESITRNHIRFRGIDGFIAAITPFNFTAIGGNLAYTPALMGNAVIWKPSDNAVLSSWVAFKAMREAGLPDGVVNFVTADGSVFGSAILSSPYLAGINFTGSVQTFRTIWKGVAKNIEIYRNIPRLVGELGGKNFHFVHSSADEETVVGCTIRSAFEYCGQKCSACSRLFVPKIMWEKELKDMIVSKTNDLIVGDVMNFESFMGAIIDDKAFSRVRGYIDYAKDCDDCKILTGGSYSNLKGYFVDPTIIECKDPYNRLFREEIFGPLLTVYVYKEKELEKAMDLVDNQTNYGLTGAIFAKDLAFLKRALTKFKNTAGNFYINDKSTGAVVGQQPFGGGRLSGTNDKAGGPQYIHRWTSPQVIKETFVDLPDIYYPYMEEALKEYAKKIDKIN